nr:hypothetical protein [Tanacetum cinerariifolium]
MGSGTFGARSTSLDSTAPLLPDHPFTHTTPDLVLSLCRTARMAMRVPLVMSPDLFASIVEVAAMSYSAFHKRFRSSYDSLPSPTFPFWKRYRGTSELILDIDSEGDELREEEVEESLDSDSQSEDAKDEGPTAGDEAPVMKTAVGEPLGLSYGALRRQEIASREGQMPSIFETPQSPEWSSGLFPISPAPSIVPSPISSHMISLTVPSPIASPATAEGFLADLGAQVKMQRGLIRDHTIRLGKLSPALFERYDRDIRELFTRSGAVRDEIFS